MSHFYLQQSARTNNIGNRNMVRSARGASMLRRSRRDNARSCLRARTRGFGRACPSTTLYRLLKGFLGKHIYQSNGRFHLASDRREWTITIRLQHRADTTQKL